MTSKASLNNFHPAFNLFGYSVRRNIGLTVLISIFMLLICPGYILMYIRNRLKYSDDVIFNFNQTLPSLIVAVSIITSAVAILFLYINFTFLYSKKSSDLFHSLPLNRRGLLFSRFFASIVPVLIPLTLTYASMCGITMLKTVNGNIATVIYGFVFNILIMLMCCAFTLVFIVCAGSVSDLIISFFSLNLGAVLAVCAGVDICQNFLVGFAQRDLNVYLKCASPFFFGFVRLSDLLNGNIKTEAGVAVFAFKLIASAVLLLAASSLLYKRRKSEKSGVSYAYRFIYIICQLIIGFIGAYALGAVFSDGEYNVFYWIFALIGAVLSSITFGAINDRGFKTVKKSIVLGICSVAGMAVLVAVMITGSFGYSSKIPDKADISSVNVSFENVNAVFDDPAAVTALHSAIVENYEDDDVYSYVDFSYTLKNGKNFNRTFMIDYDKYIDELLAIYRSPENAEGVRKVFDKFNGSSLMISEYKSTGDEDQVIDVYLTMQELDRILDAYCEDMSEATRDSITNTDITEYAIGGTTTEQDYYYESIRVEDSFTKTKEVIASLKLHQRTEVE